MLEKQEKIKINMAVNLQSIILYNAKKLTDIEYEKFCITFNDKYDYSSITDMQQLFFHCKEIKKLPDLDMSNVINAKCMFYKCINLEEIVLLNTNKLKNMEYMFYECINLKKINKFNTSNVDCSNYAFAKCKNLKKLHYFDLSNTFKSNTINCFQMFEGCEKLRKKPEIKIGYIHNDMFKGCTLIKKIEEHKILKIKQKTRKIKKLLKDKQNIMYKELNNSNILSL